MNNHNCLHGISYSAISPEGWFKETLLRQKDGMPGHLDEIGYPFDKKCWEYKSLTQGGWSKWWPYEQSAYWIDGIVRCAGLLKDDELYGKVKNQIEKAIGFDDTFIGPVEIKGNGRCFRWPIAVFARALVARWSFTGEERYLQKLRLHYLNDDNDYSGYRDVVNVETMLFLYEHFGDKRLYEKAVRAYERFDQTEEISTASDMLGDKAPLQHGVTFNEQAKLPAILYAYTSQERYLRAAEKGYEKLYRYCMLPDGVHASCEFTYGNTTDLAHETCDISDYTWSIGYLLEATGRSVYADMIERAIFNAAFGAIGPSFRTIQYFSSVNQVIAARNSTGIDAFMNAPRMAYQPHHYPECCVGNVCRAFPNYIFRMVQTFENGVCISLYGDSVYRGDDIEIKQSGNYPFGERVRFEILLKGTNQKQLRLRIPGWAKQYTLAVNGESKSLPVSDGYITFPVANGDVAEISFEKSFSAKMSADGGIYYEYGPFLLALKIAERWEIDRKEKRQTEQFPAYNVYPESPWNYCVNGKETPKLIFHEQSGHPFWDGFPFEIQIEVRRLNGWELAKKQMMKIATDGDKPELQHEMGLDAKQIECGATEVDEDLLLTPKLPDAAFIEKNKGEKETVTLVPYGCTNLRLTVFPKYEE